MKLPLGNYWTWHFQAHKNKKFLVEYAPRPPKRLTPSALVTLRLPVPTYTEKARA